MQNPQKGAIAPLLVAIVVLLAIGIVSYLYVNKEAVAPTESLPEDSAAATSTSNKAAAEEKTKTTKPATEKPLVNENANGIVKAAYIKNGKNYIDIDYVVFRHEEGDMPWGSMINDNPQIRTFEVAAGVTINLRNDYVNGIMTTGNYYVDFNKFKLIISDRTDIRAMNPWTVIVKNGVVVSMTEDFRS